ncbi:MAG: ABC transporter ATP-binding protein [Emcibacter sp.]|nr:ABC transporter ATP-binding protein [Emcibacter sp.]
MNNIELTSLSKFYGKTEALAAIDLAIAPGDCLALVGHNGAGKSTLIKMVLGLIRPTSGRAVVMGHDPMSAPFNRIRKKIGFLPEQVLFQNNLTGWETLTFYARLKGASLKDLEGLFHRVDLYEAMNNRISTYSKGMRQRLGLAQALIGSPELLILDEPTSGLDPASRQNVYNIINDMKRNGATILISSHALTELDDRIDRVAVLNRGKIVGLGSVAELRREINISSEIIIHAPNDTMEILSEHFEGKFFVNGAARISCPANEKISFLRELIGLDIPLSDIEVNDPSLEEIFLELARKREPEDE